MLGRETCRGDRERPPAAPASLSVPTFPSSSQPFVSIQRPQGNPPPRPACAGRGAPLPVKGPATLRVPGVSLQGSWAQRVAGERPVRQAPLNPSGGFGESCRSRQGGLGRLQGARQGFGQPPGGNGAGLLCVEQEPAAGRCQLSLRFLLTQGSAQPSCPFSGPSRTPLGRSHRQGKLWACCFSTFSGRH